MTKKDNDLQEKLKKAQQEAEKKDQEESKKQGKMEQNELITVKQELTEMTEMAKRAMADLQNIRQRQEKERAAMITMANAELIKAILPIMDNLALAKKHVPEDAKDWYQGIEMSINQLNTILQEFGLTEMICENKSFNPDLHEALAHGPGEKDIITEVIEKGYLLGDKVIRHAKVKIGNGEKP